MGGGFLGKQRGNFLQQFGIAGAGSIQIGIPLRMFPVDCRFADLLIRFQRSGFIELEILL